MNYNDLSKRMDGDDSGKYIKVGPTGIHRFIQAAHGAASARLTSQKFYKTHSTTPPSAVIFAFLPSAIKSTVGGFPRPLIDLSAHNFATIFDNAFEKPLSPPFDPYISSVNYLLASYIIPYMGLVAYVGTNPTINGHVSKKLLAGLLAVESGQDAVIRALLYQQARTVVHPYSHTVAEFTDRVSDLRNRLANSGIKDEGLFVPLHLGAENKTTSNILSANADSVAYARTPAEILRTVYGTGNESKPGGFLPEGGSGSIARGFLKKP